MGFALRATWLLLRGRSDELNIEFHPRGVSEEVKEELEDFEQRSHSEGEDSNSQAQRSEDRDGNQIAAGGIAK
ncbi:hypothetical protein [Marinobacterium aestuariivivens]|uniref:Uncharacterized protein n=1 Tax=Marinobacterium aestuariivivens TaxID=1698799 RepID=A0ABW2A299_9GAMM